MPRFSSFTTRLWTILEPADDGDIRSRIFDLFISTLIALSVLAVILQSVQEYDQAYRQAFRYFEVICLVIFGVEYLLRLWACGVEPEYRGLAGRFRYIFSPMALIDLAAILPGLLATGLDLRVLRSFRILRLFRLTRYSRGMRIMGRAFRASRKQLSITLSGVILFLLMSSSLLYFIENEAQPDAFSSIPASLWWGVCTLTTVGYGDVFPITSLGKFMAGIISILGIGAFALPAGIIAANFENALNEESSPSCPHCGKRLADPVLRDVGLHDEPVTPPPSAPSASAPPGSRPPQSGPSSPGE